MKCRDILDWLRKYRVLKKNCAAWNLGELHFLIIEFVLKIGYLVTGIGYHTGT